MPTPGLLDEDARWLPDTYRRLGELYEARNDLPNAIDSYSEFLDLWKNADPALRPHVTDVRERLARLVGEPGSPPSR